MVQIIRYKDFSDSHVLVSVPEGMSIARAIPILDWSKYAVIVNGVRGNERHIIQKDDIIIIRMIPKSMVTAAVVFGVAALIAAGYAGYKAYEANKAAKAAEKEIEKLKNSTSDSVTNIPYIKGASNTIATGKTQPYVIGRHLFTPYILNGGGNNYCGFHTIAGTYGVDSFYNVVLEGGFAKQILESLSCDDVKVASLLQENPQEGTFYFNSNSEFASEDSYIEIAQDGNAFAHSEFNKKIVEQEVSDQIKKADNDDYEDLYYTLETNSMACDVCIMFNGLYAITDSGVQATRTVKIIPAWSPDYAELLATDGDTDSAHWYGVGDDLTEDTDFVFKQKIITTTTTKHQGSFYYCPSSTSSIGTNYRTLEQILAEKANWTLTSGEDIRDDSEAAFSITTKKSKGKKGYTFRYYITASYTEISEAEETTESNTFSQNKSTQLRFEAHKDFSFEDNFTLGESGDYEQRQYPITIRLSCPTEAVSSGSEVSDCYVEYIHSYCYDVEESAESGELVAEKIVGDIESAKSTLIGVHIKGTSTNEEKIKKINVITNGLAPVPTKDENENWVWNLSEKTTTENPASWLVEVLTSETHKASQVSLDEIDADTFGDLYEYCDEQEITINTVLTSGTKKAEVIEGILSVCHAALYQNIYGKIAVAIDREKENPIALLNEQNLISFEYEKSVQLDVDGIRCKYIDADSDYQENNFVALYDSDAVLTEDTILREVSLDGITNETQARRQAHYIMANDKLRPLKATAKIGNEGIFFTLYSKLLVQHPSLKIGLGNAVIKNIIIDDNDMIVGVDLYDPIDIDYTNNFSVIIQCVGENYCTPLSRAIQTEKSSYLKREPFYISTGYPLELSDGSYLEVVRQKLTTYKEETLYFETPISLDAAVIPHRGDILSYGYELSTVSREFTITGIKPEGNDGYSLELYDYNEDIFDFDSVEIPEYQVTITERRPLGGTKPTAVPEVYATIEKANEIARTVSTETATEVVADKTPRYLGKLSALPESANEGDWFTANGISGLTTGYVYEYVKVSGGYEWQELTATNANYDRLMAALPDILSLRTDTDGYFGTVFAQALVANSAFIEKLAASVIELQNGGAIQSENYIEGSSGFKLDSDGNAEFNSGEFRSSVNASQISIVGIKAGDILLRSLTCSVVTSGNSLTATSQIIATGQVRLKISGSWTGAYCEGYIYAKTPTSTILLKEIPADGGSGSFSESVDVNVTEGDYVGFYIKSVGGGAVGGPKITPTSMTINTDGANGILAYLGDYGTSTKTSHASR